MTKDYYTKSLQKVFEERYGSGVIRTTEELFKAGFIAGIGAAKRCVIKESKLDKTVYPSKDFQSTHDESDGWNTARKRTLEAITVLQKRAMRA